MVKEQQQPVFNIGVQNGIANNVVGNQTNYGDQVVNSGTPSEALQAVNTLQRIIQQAELQPTTKGQAAGDLAEAVQELEMPSPDRSRVASSLTRLLSLLISTGSVLGASTQIVRSFSVILQWLGPVGDHLQGLVGALPR